MAKPVDIHTSTVKIFLKKYFPMIEFLYIHQWKVTSRNYALKQGNRIGVRFIKYDIQGVFLK
jgi:hypothetical protein